MILYEFMIIYDNLCAIFWEMIRCQVSNSAYPTSCLRCSQQLWLWLVDTLLGFATLLMPQFSMLFSHWSTGCDDAARVDTHAYDMICMNEICWYASHTCVHGCSVHFNPFHLFPFEFIGCSTQTLFKAIGSLGAGEQGSRGWSCKLTYPCNPM